MICADEGHVSPAGRTVEVHRILRAACRIRVEGFVEEVNGDPRRSPGTRSGGMTECLIWEYLISAAPSSPALCGVATSRVGLKSAGVHDR
jgi:hypothetical protein